MIFSYFILYELIDKDGQKYNKEESQIIELDDFINQKKLDELKKVLLKKYSNSDMIDIKYKGITFLHQNKESKEY